ncbi:MAG: hypothetical protein WCS85_01015 [Candidatus Peribacteraceae bacterium]|jgi:hypothetical protein
MADEVSPLATTTYKDDDLVYVDPDQKIVVGVLEWSRNGNPKSKPIPAEEREREGRRGWRKHYPFGTYRSMKNAFRLEGKQRKEQGNLTLDDAIQKAMKEPFWD